MTQATASAPAQGNDLEKIQNQYLALLGAFQSVQLATVDDSGVPFASYSPAVLDDERNFYVYVSEIANHTQNLRGNGRASFMVIEDETLSHQIFARKRITFNARGTEVARDSKKWEEILGRFEEKFGKVVEHLKTMDDFHLIRLEPQDGRLVLGFGRAYSISADLQHVEHLKGLDGGGHRKVGSKPSVAGPITPEVVARIAGHMNEDHADSVLMYVQHYAARKDAQSAVLVNIDHEGMDIDTVFPGGSEIVRVPFEKPLAGPSDAHLVLVEMSKIARKALQG